MSAAACAGGGGPSGARIGGDGPPDWLTAGGNSPRYPRQRFVTGIATVEMGSGQGGVEAARQQAAADLSRKISVRIEAQLRDVTQSRDGADTYEVQSIVNSTSNIRLTGLDYEIWADAQRSHALAYLERGYAIRERRGLRQRSLAEVRECLASGERHLAAGREADALSTFQSCRTPIAEALEHDSIARALGAASPEDDAAYAELVAANRRVDDLDKQILRSPASNLGEAIERLGIKLARQGATTRGRIVVSPFTYGTTDLSSEFGRQASIELESVMIRHGTRAAESGPRVVRGVYLEREQDVRITATVRDSDTGQLLASAETSLPKRAMPTGISLKPANFEQVLREQRLLGEGELLSSDLELELWTDRGRRGVVYTENEEMAIHFRVNQPSYVRVIYVLQNGDQVLLRNAWKVNEAQINKVITFPDRYEIVPPFGVEMVHATAFTEPPTPLYTETRLVDGIRYDIVVDGTEQIVRTRGLRRKRQQQMAESLVTVTTVPR